jgi:transcriptional regulator with XRE-family HTH domain
VEVAVRAGQAQATIGRRMREVRDAAGITLRTAAARSGWDKGHLSRVERGLVKPSRQLVAWYDEAYGVCGGLVHQFAELEESVRLDRARSLRDRREAARPGPGGSVPEDYDPRDRSLLHTENVPDGSLMAPGEVFEKAWTLHNDGPVAWTGRWLSRQAGTGPGWLRSERRVQVPDTPAGGLVTIHMAFTSPAAAGSSIAYFKMTDGDGRPYFPSPHVSPLYCTVKVTL